MFSDRAVTKFSARIELPPTDCPKVLLLIASFWAEPVSLVANSLSKIRFGLCSAGMGGRSDRRTSCDSAIRPPGKLMTPALCATSVPENKQQASHMAERELLFS